MNETRERIVQLLDQMIPPETATAQRNNVTSAVRFAGANSPKLAKTMESQKIRKTKKEDAEHIQEDRSPAAAGQAGSRQRQSAIDQEARKI